MTTKDEALRELILATARDSAIDFAAYDRKEDEELSIDDLSAAIARKVVTVEEIGEAFMASLRENL